MESASEKSTEEKNTGSKTTGGGNSLAGYDLTWPLGEPIKVDDQKLFILHLKWYWDGNWDGRSGLHSWIKSIESGGF